MDRRLITIFIIVFANLMGANIVLPTLPLYSTREFGASPEQVSWLLAAYFIALFIAAPWIGRLSDRYGRIPILIISQLGTFVSFIMMGTATALPLLLAGRVLDGITGGNIIVLQAYITDITAPKDRTRALGLIWMAFGLGFMFGPAIGGVVSGLTDDRMPFWIGAGFALLTVVLTLLTLRENMTPAERAARRATQRPLRADEILHNPPLLLILLIGFGAQFSLSLMISSIALFSEAVIFAGQSANQVNIGVGLLLACVGVGQFFTQVFLIKRLVPRYGEQRMVLIGTVLRGVALLSLTVFTSPFLVGGFSLLLFAAASGVMMPSLQTLATYTVDSARTGGVIGVYQSSISLGIIFGTAIAGVLFSSAPTLPFFVGGIMMFIIAVPAVALVRRGVLMPAAA